MSTSDAEYERTSYSTVGGRTRSRGVYDKAVIHGIINSALVVNVAFIDEEGLPSIVPMNGQIEEDEDGPYVLLHDIRGRVLGLSAKAHSYNYLSAVVHGYSDERIDKHDLVTKRILSEKIVNHIVPGRWEEVRQPTDTEIYEVGFIKMRIEAASAKRRDAGPGDYPSDIANQELRNRVWTGVIPIEYAHGKPQPTEYNVVSAPKDYWNGGAPSL